MSAGTLTSRRAICLAAAAILATSVGASPAQRHVTLPNDTIAYTASDLPGYQLVQRNCIGCHSAHYAATQPPSSSRAYWDATVKKMKKPFGAPFPDDDIAAMVDYLVKTYGAERAAPGRGAALSPARNSRHLPESPPR